MKKPVLAITMGDPAGIGSEITLKALQDPKLYDEAVPVVFGDAGQLRRVASIARIGAQVVAISSAAVARQAAPSPSRIAAVDLHNIREDVPFGRISADCGKAAYEYIASAIDAALRHEVQACVTAPLNKEAL
ncbi:MAG: 4-hydroxythreonine-4-phosphate dehydrogenase PdxA, partial [Succinivibrio sp.]